MNQLTTTVRNHCPSPVRARVAIDAPIGPANYARMFPELPSFEADEQFLHALGLAGGLCDCGATDDSPFSLGESAAGWPIFGQFVAHDITADRSILRSHTNTADLRNARNPQLNLECLYGDGPTGQRSRLAAIQTDDEAARQDVAESFVSGYRTVLWLAAAQPVLTSSADSTPTVKYSQA